MVFETRYFRLVLGVKQLLTAAGASSQYLSGAEPEIFWGIRVWKGAAELTAGVPVAQTAIDFAGWKEYSAAWACGGSAAAGEVIVKLYNWSGDLVYHEIATFSTTDMNAKVLDASIWTVFYWLRQIFDPDTLIFIYSMFGYNSAIFNSRITNFSWSEAAPSAEPLMDGFMYID